MIIKSLVDHRVTVHRFMKEMFKRIYYSVPSFFFRPEESPVGIFFVSGCGHSGTTLMAAKLSNHPDILGVGRETSAMLPGRNSLYGMRAITNEWKYFAESYGFNFVLEKTPKHLYAYDAIQKVVPSNKFVVMVRNPLDTIASLSKRFNDLDFSIERWIFDNKQALHIGQNDNVLFVRYEDFTNSPESTLKGVTEFLGVPYRSEMLEETGSVYDGIRQSQENMRLRQEQVAKPIRPNEGGWKKVFSEQEAKDIIKKLGDLPNRLGYDYSDFLKT